MTRWPPRAPPWLPIAGPPFVARTVWFGRSSASEGNQGVLTHHGWLVVHDETHALAARVAAEDATQTWDCDRGARIERFAWSDVHPIAELFERGDLLWASR
ncbi:MAG: hypothetical protein K1X94_03795 [Sandaracinaceae bacterium]|nr:hypothetical protein [Sandaracinaceae bacterium]